MSGKSRDGLLPFRPVCARNDYISDDLFVACNFAVAFLSSAMQLKKLHWHADDIADRQLEAGCMADAARFVSKFIGPCQDAFRKVSSLLTAARPTGPFAIGQFTEENAHWVAYRVGVAAATCLLRQVGHSVRFAMRDGETVDIAKAIIENWDRCREAMAQWEMPDTKRIEAEVLWEAHQAEKHGKATQPSPTATPVSALQQARNWLYMRYGKHQHKLKPDYPPTGDGTVYSADGSAPRKATAADLDFVPIRRQELHQFLISIGADIASITLACEEQGWIRFGEGGYDVNNMDQLFHILPAIQNPWTEADGPKNTTEPNLGDRQYDILDALFELKAFTPDTKQKTATIATRLGIDPAALKEPMSGLVNEHHLVESKTGRGGGVWLSAKGKNQVERQRKR